MGLDMYAWKVPAEIATSDVDVDFPEGFEPERMHYWRKHPNLHGWMESLYREKGGTGRDFNCNTVRITVEDLDRLEKDVGTDALPATSGFFFGRSEPEDRKLDLEFIQKARTAISEGSAVYYDSWW